jgi:hypothetical protein
MGRYYIHVTDGEHTIPDETGGEFASIHQVQAACGRDGQGPDPGTLAGPLSVERLRVPHCERRRSVPAPHPVTACLDSGIVGEPA